MLATPCSLSCKVLRRRQDRRMSLALRQQMHVQGAASQASPAGP